MHSDWRCDACGAICPLHLPKHIGSEVLGSVIGQARRHPQEQPPLWCPWPFPTGWIVTGVGWVGDERGPVRACVLACSGPAPLTGGPADLLLVSEVPGVGLANRYAGLPGVDPGPMLSAAMAGRPADAKVRADGHPTPLWSVPSREGRSAYVGEARGLWLVAVAWPENAGYLLAEDLVLCDLIDWLPAELVYGALSVRLRGENTG